MSNNQQVQWAGQFGVAHQLYRRGYEVSFTLGNSAKSDIWVRSPSDKMFQIEVKSKGSRTYFFCGKKQAAANPESFYVFCVVPKVLEKPVEFYIVPCREALRAIEEENAFRKQRIAEGRFEAAKHQKWFDTGFRPNRVAQFKDRWDLLPE